MAACRRIRRDRAPGSRCSQHIERSCSRASCARRPPARRARPRRRARRRPLERARGAAGARGARAHPHAGGLRADRRRDHHRHARRRHERPHAPAGRGERIPRRRHRRAPDSCSRRRSRATWPRHPVHEPRRAPDLGRGRRAARRHGRPDLDAGRVPRARRRLPPRPRRGIRQPGDHRHDGGPAQRHRGLRARAGLARIADWRATSARLRGEHRGVVAAIRAADAATARTRMHDHISGYYAETSIDPHAQAPRGRPVARRDDA